MSAEKLEVDVSHEMCVTCTVDTISDQNIYSSEFWFQGAGWKLNYFKSGTCYGYGLLLCKCSGVSPNPLQVSVHVESSEDGRVAKVLPEERRFTTEFEKKKFGYPIWWKRERQILRSFPGFRLHGVLKLIVVLKAEEKDSAATQSECSIPEGVELPCVASLLEDFQRMMTVQGTDRDVEFRCADQSFKAHAAVVCARSPVICDMLGSAMVEGRTRIVDIPDMTPDVFRIFLGYLYSGKLPELSFEVALSLYESGEQYAILGLERRCRKYLVEHLTVQNACDVLVVADAHSDEDFAEKVVAYMLETRVPQTSDGWSAFSDDHPKLAIKVLKRGWDV